MTKEQILELMKTLSMEDQAWVFGKIMEAGLTDVVLDIKNALDDFMKEGKGNGGNTRAE
jgi:hypothetical protein